MLTLLLQPAGTPLAEESSEGWAVTFRGRLRDFDPLCECGEGGRAAAALPLVSRITKVWTRPSLPVFSRSVLQGSAVS